MVTVARHNWLPEQRPCYESSRSPDQEIPLLSQLKEKSCCRWQDSATAPHIRRSNLVHSFIFFEGQFYYHPLTYTLFQVKYCLQDLKLIGLSFPNFCHAREEVHSTACSADLSGVGAKLHTFLDSALSRYECLVARRSSGLVASISYLYALKKKKREMYCL